MVGTLDKPKLTRSILENHGIHYHEDVYVPQDETRTLAMPVHVHKLREALTEFSNVRIMDNRKGMFMDQGMGLQAAYEDRGINASGWNLIPPDSTYDSRQKISDDHEDWKEVIERIENNFYDSKDIASDARSLDYEAESGWMKFLRDHFFKRFKRKRYGNDSDEQHKKRLHLDEFSLEEDILWDESKRAFQWKENFTPGIRERTGPKPDIVYGFKAFEFNKVWRGFEAMPYFQNFSFDVLSELRARNPPIQSTVTGGLSRWHRWQVENRENRTRRIYSGKLLTPDFLCFPWAIVEVKHAESKMQAEEFCQCQLANATACAYDLQEKLIRSLKGNDVVDPIIGFTCIGPRVRLWLTYRGDDSKMHMVCIWATSLEGSWGVLCLIEIIACMRTWASRILRGKIVQYIHRAYSTCSPMATNATHNDAETGLAAPGGDATSETLSTINTAEGIAGGESAENALAEAVLVEEPKAPAPKQGVPKSNGRIRVQIPRAAEPRFQTTLTSNYVESMKQAAEKDSDALANEPSFSASQTPRVKKVCPVPPTFQWNHTFKAPSEEQLSDRPKHAAKLPIFGEFTEPIDTVFRTEAWLNTNLVPSNGPYRLFSYPGPTEVKQKRDVSTFPKGRFGIEDDHASTTASSTKVFQPTSVASLDLHASIPRIWGALPTDATDGASPHAKELRKPPTPSVGTPTPIPFVLPENIFERLSRKLSVNPQSDTLSPPKQPLRSSHSDSNLAAKACNAPPLPSLTIFQKLAQQDSTNTMTSGLPKELPEESEIRFHVDQPRSVLYPLLPTHARSVSSDGSLNAISADSRPRSVTDAGTGAIREHETCAPS